MTERPRRRASCVCVHDSALLVVYLEDPLTKVIRPFVPGGEIQSSESPADAAIRETKEETGLTVEVDATSPRNLTYDFFWGGKVVPCHTTFFRGILRHPGLPSPPKEAEPIIKRASFMPLKDFETALSYHREIQEVIRSLLIL